MSAIYYPPLEVYKNLHHLLKNRKLELVSGFRVAGTRSSNRTKEQKTTDKKYLDDQTFIRNIQFDKFIIVEARDAPEKDRRYKKSINEYSRSLPTKTFIIILDRTSEAIKSPDLQKILMKLPDIKSQSRKFNMDVILITENELTNHPIKKLHEFQTDGSDSVGFVHFVHKIYTLFIMNIFDHISVPEHTILTRDEETIVLSELKIQRHQLPKIHVMESVCVVLGAEVDDIIQIIAFNENSGLEPRYRLVV